MDKLVILKDEILEAQLCHEKVQEILICFSLEDVDEALSEMLLSDDYEKYEAATLFIRDVVNYKLSDSFIKHVYQSNSLAIIENALFGEDPTKRRGAIYTLGKICATQSLAKMHEALSQLEEIETSTIKSLQFAISWLEGIAKGKANK